MLGIDTAPRTTPHHTAPKDWHASYQELRAKCIDLEEQLRVSEQDRAAKDRIIAEARERERATDALLSTPNEILSPTERIATYYLRKDKRNWDRKGKTGLQTFQMDYLCEKVGVKVGAARAALHRIADAQSINLQVRTVGEGRGKRHFFAVEMLPQLDQPPTTWNTERDPNGKKCACGGRTYAVVVPEEVTTRRLRLDHTCYDCKKVHSTRTYKMSKPVTRQIGKARTFQTVEQAVAFVETGDLTPEIDLSSWSKNYPPETEIQIGGETPENADSSQSTCVLINQREGERVDSSLEGAAAPEMDSRSWTNNELTQTEAGRPASLTKDVQKTEVQTSEIGGVLGPRTTDAEALMLAIAGNDNQHIEMCPTGRAKYTTPKGRRPVTREDVRAHIAGTKMIGTTLQHDGGMTTALKFDSDNATDTTIIVDAAGKLATAGASPLLEDSPSVTHRDGVQLVIIFDGLVDAASAYATVLKVAPDLARIKEHWPCANRVRLPGGYYKRPGAEGWCSLRRPAGMRFTGAAAFDLMVQSQTPASWVTESPPPTTPTPTTTYRATATRMGGWIPPTRPIPHGQRDASLRDYACAMRTKSGMNEAEILDELRRINDELCEYVPGDIITDAILVAKARDVVRKYAPPGL